MTRPANNENPKIWRYMDLAQFVSLLANESLWFSSAKFFDDPFEGSHSKLYAKTMNNLNLTEDEKAQKIKIARELPKYTFINCWHISDIESYAMWKIYGKSGSSVAIQSTYNKLYGALKNYNEVTLGLVDYKDYETEQLSVYGPTELVPFFNKGKTFHYEQELRAVIQYNEKLNKIFASDKDMEQEELPTGLERKVDLNALIESIYVSPGAPVFFKNSVTAILDKFGYTKLQREIVYSKLEREPIYGSAI
ncbi:hypothetical protein CW740_00150 [Kangiella profundi]|uniref:DUF2971 domain-containing protein n=2 Tax=Kangiella profundi TaxID=1561924 RepID=A0A2K9AUY3_9GAMM|nr:hypothetical protein CW740_00150 [Kangiella profundi]